MPTLMSQKNAAHKLLLSTRTLERHRVSGTGPAYVKLGHIVRYEASALEEWVRLNTRTSTSQSTLL
jgi:predicted DNA-binding transcriptional regulator AlpA